MIGLTLLAACAGGPEDPDSAAIDSGEPTTRLVDLTLRCDWPPLHAWTAHARGWISGVRLVFAPDTDAEELHWLTRDTEAPWGGAQRFALTMAWEPEGVPDQDTTRVPCEGVDEVPWRLELLDGETGAVADCSSSLPASLSGCSGPPLSR